MIHIIPVAAFLTTLSAFQTGSQKNMVRDTVKFWSSSDGRSKNGVRGVGYYSGTSEIDGLCHGDLGSCRGAVKSEEESSESR
jgi:hypothetical protein